ncbi:BnaA06g03170D [Brassica napus]|uniref:BnaA06g03170D protein n=1 Tax=Brassica napus TaxID=3708 RepID=A0A078ID83_BRANA|nr:BnaA06g03170D [Brassica napus]
MSAKQILQKFDKNNDGKLSLEEFREAALAFSKNIPDEEITNMFKEFDVDGDASEFHAAMTGLGEDFTEEKCAEMVQAVDADGDGYVSFEEFMAMIIGEFKE